MADENDEQPGRPIGVPSSAPREEEPADGEVCAESARLLQRFLHEGLKGEDDARFRRHLVDCADCRQTYRTTLSDAACLGRALRETREEAARERRRKENRRRAIQAGVEPKRRRFGLRLALVPAGLVILFTQLPRLGEATGTAVWGQGRVEAAGMDLGASRDRVEVERGDWCVTSASSNARVESGDGVFLLGERTQLLVEDPDQGRIRLQRGRLSAEGSCVVASQAGIVHIEDGRAEIVFEGGRLEVVCVDGSVDLTDALGSRHVAPGQTILAGLRGVGR